MTTPALSVDLTKLGDLDRQATPGPWTWEAVGEKDNSWCLGTECEGEVVDFVAQSGTCENLADPALIAEVRNALPSLLAEVRRLRAVAETALAVYRAWDEDRPHVNKMFSVGRALRDAGYELRPAPRVGGAEP